MALIKLTDISVDNLDNSSLDQGYLYKDLFLDLTPSVYYNAQINKQVTLRDVQGSFDEQAIKDSITNAFLTSPGQKILSPEYGIDLRRYLFEPVTDFNGFQIQDDIVNRLPDMEPRIQVDRVVVQPIPDQHEYFITLQINVPSLNIYGLSLQSLLNNNGYFVL
jgi:phage baseplate assembly protein W|tara:strand:- start:3979 stop:4467 length:489 start_codon:yes stop_codon:yes gene_type:complete